MIKFGLCAPSSTIITTDYTISGGGNRIELNMSILARVMRMSESKFQLFIWCLQLSEQHILASTLCQLNSRGLVRAIGYKIPLNLERYTTVKAAEAEAEAEGAAALQPLPSISAQSIHIAQEVLPPGDVVDAATRPVRAPDPSIRPVRVRESERVRERVRERERVRPHISPSGE